MTKSHPTPLAQLYQELVDSGAIVPVQEAGRFSYPSMRVHVPNVTTFGVGDLRGLSEEQRAKLESGINRNKQ